jgi:hypothetical protein
MRLADQVEIAWGVEDFQFLVHPRAMQQRSLRGNLALLFADVTIRTVVPCAMLPMRPMTPAHASIASLSVVLPDDA